MSLVFNNRVALITGGTRGIGAAIAKNLHDKGCKVVTSYNNNSAAAKKFTESTGIPAYSFDVCNYNDCESKMKEIEASYGPVDILVNNAGITKDSMFHKMDPENWHKVINNNLTSCFNMARSVIEGMRKRGFGRIINISSINGQKGQLGQVNYAAAKAGLMGFTKALALENASKGITVNTVTPGYVETDMVASVSPDVMKNIVSQIPVGRLAKPQEIARAVAFLASDDAGFITGATISVNGGQYMA
jgi:acetoacetyl-CoA reductase